MDNLYKLKWVVGEDYEHFCECERNCSCTGDCTCVENCSCEEGKMIDHIEGLLEKVNGHDSENCYCNDCRELGKIGFSVIRELLVDITGENENFKVDCRIEDIKKGSQLWLVASRSNEEIGKVLYRELTKKEVKEGFTAMLGIGWVIERAGYSTYEELPNSNMVVLDLNHKDVNYNLKNGNSDKRLIEIYPNTEIEYTCSWCTEDEIEIEKIENSDLYRCTSCENEDIEESFAMVYVNTYCPTCEVDTRHWIEDLEERDNCVVGVCWCDNKNVINIEELKKVVTK